jgi:hypothetical protein
MPQKRSRAVSERDDETHADERNVQEVANGATKFI